ncbi:MAG TPA: C40 family peptidase [Sediminibacterium sp.]|nr:C40 family peptidase [Sediminibacterium sp.]
MGYVVGYTAAAPLRAEAAHRSEMVSQLLFGETAEILDTAKDFIKIRCSYDGYEGWCQHTQLVEIPDEQAAAAGKNLAAGYTNLLDLNGTPMQIPMGASLGLFNNHTARMAHFHFTYQGTVANPDEAIFEPGQIRRLAIAYLHTPYLWGGRSVFGIDCSGYAQQVYRFFNKALPRDACQQAELGEVVGFLQEAVTGDLAFFDNEEGRITHVGILLDAETIIHSSGRVRVDKIDNMGIISSDTGERTHRLRLMKSYR